MATAAELVLSAAYREAQRQLASWLERSHREARRGVFALRTALAGLDAIERHRLARWLAWLCAAAGPRGVALHLRIRHLDGPLGEATATALAQLPPLLAPARGLRQSPDWGISSRIGS